VNEALQHLIYPRDVSGSVTLYGQQVRSCRRPVNPGEVAKAVSRIAELLGPGIARLQQLMKFVEEVDIAEVRQAPMITGDGKISGRTAHSTLTSLKVRLAWNRPKCSKPASARPTKALWAPRMRRIQVVAHPHRVLCVL